MHVYLVRAEAEAPQFVENLIGASTETACRLVMRVDMGEDHPAIEGGSCANPAGGLWSCLSTGGKV